MTTYQTGDTVRLQATFYTFAGVLSDLAAAPTLKIYYPDETLLTTVAGSSLTKPSTGVYYYDWTIPSVAGVYVWEMSGTVESTTILRRDSITAVFK